MTDGFASPDERRQQPAGGERAPGPFTAPKLALPTGGGAHRGIGETFKANAVNGTATFRIPIATSPGPTCQSRTSARADSVVRIGTEVVMHRRRRLRSLVADWFMPLQLHSWR
jgi:hypothetical protein